jgi:hypothetical protein
LPRTKPPRADHKRAEGSDEKNDLQSQRPEVKNSTARTIKRRNNILFTSLVAEIYRK